MYNRQLRQSAVVLLALGLMVGYGAAPVAAVEGSTTPLDEHGGEENDVPEEFCTDITGMVHEEVPYDQVIWVDDLPEDVQQYLQPSVIPGTENLPEDYQPPNSIPYNLLTPEAMAALAIGYAPNQCDVFDPNDPPYDPQEDNIDPDGGADIVEETENETTLVIVNGTVDQTGEGPGAEMLIEFNPDTNGSFGSEVLINDGEKDYGIKPGVQYWDDGTVYMENDGIIIGDRYGVAMDCRGEYCSPSLRGLPGFINILGFPGVPSPTDGDASEYEDGNEDEAADEDDSTNENDSTDGNEVGDEEGTSGNDGQDELDNNDGSTPDTDAGGNEADDSESSPSGSDGGSDTESGNDNGQSQGEASGDEETSGDSEDTNTDNEANDVTEEAAENRFNNQESPAQDDGSGFGVIGAVLSVMLIILAARRRY